MQLINSSNIILLVMAFFSLFSNAQESQKKVLFCYGEFFPEKIIGYQYVIVEPSNFSAAGVKILKSNNTNVLAYISLGEVDSTSDYYTELKDLTIGTNPIWNSYVLDLKESKTRSILSRKLNSYIKDKGFDGLFLDNIDNFTKFGPTPEQRPDLISFLKEIRTNHPKLFLMQNAGLELLDDSQVLVDALAIESIATDYDFMSKQYRLRSKMDFKLKTKELSELTNAYEIPIILVEYANSEYLRNQIFKRVENMGYLYFIGTIDLQNIPN